VHRTLATIATMAGLLVLPAPVVLAQKAAPAAEAQAYDYQLMTPAERDEWRQRMAAAKTAEERAKLRDEHHAAMLKRAEENGVTLQGRRGDPQLYGQQLMTPAERNAHLEKLRAATTHEERLKLRDEHRAEMQKRAKEKGITLPEPRGPGAGRPGPGRGPGPGPGPGGPGNRP
jgi:hypothetical protein